MCNMFGNNIFFYLYTLANGCAICLEINIFLYHLDELQAAG